MCALCDALKALNDQPRKPVPNISAFLVSLKGNVLEVPTGSTIEFDASVKFIAGIEASRLIERAKRSPSLAKLVLTEIAALLITQVEGMPS